MTTNYVVENHADEIAALVSNGPPPLQQFVSIEADEFLFFTRLQKTNDRRGEIGVCLRRPNGRYLVHTKNLYPGIYRLPTGGIHHSERVADALVREVREETSLEITGQRLLAVVNYQFHFRGQTLPFVTYLFHADEAGGELRADEDEVAAFSELPLSSFHWLAQQLRSLPPPRQAWGAWRAVAHEVALEILTGEGTTRE